jgi:hypothetical protein
MSGGELSGIAPAVVPGYVFVDEATVPPSASKPARLPVARKRNVTDVMGWSG